MTKKEIRLNSKMGQPSEIDDLKLINGIGQAVEKRLHGIGIFTYAQLAALSSADIAAAVEDINGLSAERITKQDWIGQARKLASELETSSSQPIALLQIKSKKDPIIRLTGAIQVLDFEMIGVESLGPRRIIALGKAFDVRITLDISKLLVPANNKLLYKIAIYGKSWGKSGFVVGATQGSITQHEKVAIAIQGIMLPKEATYQLTATIILGLPGIKLVASPGTTAIVDGGLLEVY